MEGKGEKTYTHTHSQKKTTTTAKTCSHPMRKIKKEKNEIQKNKPSRHTWLGDAKKTKKKEKEKGGRGRGRESLPSLDP